MIFFFTWTHVALQSFYLLHALLKSSPHSEASSATKLLGHRPTWGNGTEQLPSFYCLSRDDFLGGEHEKSSARGTERRAQPATTDTCSFSIKHKSSSTPSAFPAQLG